MERKEIKIKSFKSKILREEKLNINTDIKKERERIKQIKMFVMNLKETGNPKKIKKVINLEIRRVKSKKEKSEVDYKYLGYLFGKKGKTKKSQKYYKKAFLNKKEILEKDLSEKLKERKDRRRCFYKREYRCEQTDDEVWKRLEELEELLKRLQKIYTLTGETTDLERINQLYVYIIDEGPEKRMPLNVWIGPPPCKKQKDRKIGEKIVKSE